MTRRQGDQGFTLIELLLVIVVIGILATIVVASAFGVRSSAQDVTCESEARLLESASEAYFAVRPAMSITPSGSGADRFELALVQDGVLRAPSTYYDLDANGDLQQTSGSPCTT
jgi:prepilin-type N-terminal cleavage/methylation domain-containing protein